MAAKGRIGILGSGDVGKQLGRGLARHGFDVKLGSREPAKLAAWKKEVGAHASVGTFAEAAAHGDLVILATSGAGTEAAIDLAGPKQFAGKVVIDATNPLDFSRGMPPTLFVGTTDSLGERVQRQLADAKVVKCFNTVGNARIVDPKFAEGAPKMLICGNDAAAKRRVEELLQDIGWPGALDVGGIDGARWLEALVPLWVRAGQAMNTWEHAFQVVR
jgi:8-hydroxy-5-deazaflavin:NADPH oxidoreductase